ncbi:hypothetical protein ACE193_10105 [Bernardetia sp. OM2101]|uniref:hypothetical protein n=1 Tax=Bernardetia sp. OM2101 TaxID=3344876 RepID=UPI0035D0D971
MAFAQSPEEKASFLTNEMNTLLSLTTEQTQKVTLINTRRFKVENNAKARLDDNARYQNAKSENFQSEAGQQMLVELNTRIEQGENRYDLALNNVLDASQYSIYVQYKASLFEAVATEFGE